MSTLEFEWHDDKNALNRAKHGIDFEDAIAIFEGPLLVRPSHRGDEERFVAVGSAEGVEIAVVYTQRDSAIRLISARRARRNEREAYRQTFAERT
ncbi:MAG: BrnT family toxin [Rhodospirillaceae bacterium]|nr:BrnT family toxin [Rhodospirillales bacterium]